MNIKIFILFILSFYAVKAQKNTESSIQYLNMSSISLTKNTESYFKKFSKEEDRSSQGSSIDINTIHGAVFWDFIALSTGISLDYNIDETFLSTPVLVDLRVFSSDDRRNSLFAYLQTGKNIKWSNSFDGNGTTAKLGVGLIFSDGDSGTYYIDVFKKSKNIELSKYKEKGNYSITAFGLSFGVIF